MTTRRRIATSLAALIALSGILPLALLAAVGLRIVAQRGEQSSQEALQAIAEQAAARVQAYVAQQRELLRTVAMAVGTEADAQRRLVDATLDAPSLGKLRLISAQTPQADLPHALDPPQIEKALGGAEVASGTFLSELAPAMDVCVPCGLAGHSVCSTLDLLELQRQVQRIRVGDSGYALAFDRTGRLIAAGSGTMRAAVLSGERVAESAAAALVASGAQGPHRLEADRGEVIAGWAALPDLAWSIAVEEPVDEALRGVRTAGWWLAAGAVSMLGLSLGVGVALALRMLGALELEERFRTAGQIAAGITHDLGHRLAILKQTRALAETNDPAYLPRIRDSLSSEVETLQRFVLDFADLTREPKPTEFLPIEVNAFAESVRASADAYAAQHGVAVELTKSPGELWIRGDRYLLERAALNLTRNAIEASRPDARVVLRVVNTDSRAIIEVRDEGSGISASRIPSLFESFSSTKRTGAHVGMGLPNVRRIITAHGGSIFVRSTEGKGSTFSLSLPMDLSAPGQLKS